MAKKGVKENSFFTGMESFNNIEEKAQEIRENKITEAKKTVLPESAKNPDVMRQSAIQSASRLRPGVAKEKRTVRMPLLVAPSVAMGIKEIARQEGRSVNDIVHEMMSNLVDTYNF